MKEVEKSKVIIPNKVFIDGQNIETGLRVHGLEVDYQSLFNYLIDKYTYLSEDLEKLTKKISPRVGSGGIDET